MWEKEKEGREPLLAFFVLRPVNVGLTLPGVKRAGINIPHDSPSRHVFFTVPRTEAAWGSVERGIRVPGNGQLVDCCNGATSGSKCQSRKAFPLV